VLFPGKAVPETIKKQISIVMILAYVNLADKLSVVAVEISINHEANP
jgi:hypothetical protein